MDKEYAFMREHGGGIVGFETLQKARDYFEIPYDKRHGSTYERSMSACIHYVFFQPQIVHVGSRTDLQMYFVKPRQAVSWQTMAGSMDGVLLDRKKATALSRSRKAVPVRLIKSEDEYREHYGSLKAEPS
jgi:hypothetical protein